MTQKETPQVGGPGGVRGNIESHIVSLLNQHFGSSTKTPRGLSQSTLALRDVLLEIIDSDGGPWTTRGLFYACSVRHAGEKTHAGYRRVQQQVLLMRREGLIDYAVVADNTRLMRKPTTFDSMEHWIERSISTLRLDLWRDNDKRVELWLEKDALSGVLYDVTAKWHVPLMVARGYSSESFAYAAAEAIQNNPRMTHILYLGDFDPSGINAADDLESRLRGFLDDEDALIFTRLAVTPQQIEEWRLPSRPTKSTDTRYKDFRRRFGDIESTELDSIPPSQLREMVENAIVQHVDAAQNDRIVDEQREARALLKKTFGAMKGSRP